MSESITDAAPLTTDPIHTSELSIPPLRDRPRPTQPVVCAVMLNVIVSPPVIVHESVYAPPRNDWVLLVDAETCVIVVVAVGERAQREREREIDDIDRRFDKLDVSVTHDHKRDTHKESKCVEEQHTLVLALVAHSS